jgi:SAM-dependent methyltransferase
MRSDQPPDLPELDRIRDFYESQYYRDAAPGGRIPRHYVRLARRIGLRPGQKILDVACGTGSWLRAAAQCGAAPTGIDLSAKAIGICRIEMPEGLFEAGPAETLPFDDGSFDVVSCLGSIEHFVDPLLALREMVRVARPAATFVLVVPNAGFLTRRLGLYGGTQQAAVREVVRTLPAWAELFAQGGLQVEERWRDLHVLSWSWIAAAGTWRIPLRAAQALALAVWPLEWQYQVYFRCRNADHWRERGSPGDSPPAPGSSSTGIA